MTDANPPEPAKLPPETLALRAPPPRVGRISRPILIGTTAIGLMGLAGIVLFALRPPSFQIATPTELITADRKIISDSLSRLPATYDGVRAQPPSPPPAKVAPPMPTAISDAQLPADSEERMQTARMLAQAREAPVLFRLQTVSPTLPGPVPAATTGAVPRQTMAIDPGPLPNAMAVTPGDGAQPDGGDQLRKLAFLKSVPDPDTLNPHVLQTPVSPYQLMAGTIIAASLVTGLNSDLPGFVIAQVTENVFDSVSGRYLLIPQGSRLIGKYDSVVAFGEERALLVWQRIILPDGSSVVLDNLPATDTGGYAGLSDQVDLHTWKLLQGIALSTVLGVGQTLAFGPNTNDSDLVKALKQSSGQTTSQAGQHLVDRQLNVQPTLTIRPGWPLRVIVHKDLVLKPYRAP